MPTVEVYQVEPDDSTGAFLGFGSLLDPSIVFLHPPSATPPVKPGRPGAGSVERRPDRPAAPSRPIVAQRLPDQEEQGAAAPARPAGGRARCRIRSGLSVLTLDGDILAAPTEVAAPTAIQLDLVFSGDIDQLRVPQGPGHPTAEEAAEAVIAFVNEAALGDPPAPTDPPPDGADVDDHHPHPGRRPWYCVICPGAFGC